MADRISMAVKFYKNFFTVAGSDSGVKQAESYRFLFLVEVTVFHAEKASARSDPCQRWYVRLEQL